MGFSALVLKCVAIYGSWENYCYVQTGPWASHIASFFCWDTLELRHNVMSSKTKISKPSSGVKIKICPAVFWSYHSCSESVAETIYALVSKFTVDPKWGYPSVGHCWTWFSHGPIVGKISHVSRVSMVSCWEVSPRHLSALLDTLHWRVVFPFSPSLSWFLLQEGEREKKTQ